jgi:hypothetical protein
MFMVVRKYGLAGPAGEAARRVEAGLVPLLRRAPGLRAYHAFDGGDGIGGSVSLFESEEAALAGLERGGRGVGQGGPRRPRAGPRAGGDRRRGAGRVHRGGRLTIGTSWGRRRPDTVRLSF